MELPTLADRERAGYVIDEWKRWQQGGCLEYAVALIRRYPGLRFGTLGESDGDGGWWVSHHIAHDDEWAYDSAGRHRLPYNGIDGVLDVVELNGNAEDYEYPDEDEVAAALLHIERHGIGPV